MKSRVNSAHVLAIIAIALALGGNAIAFTLGKNSVGTKQLKKNAVKTGKIAPEAVKAGKLAKNSIATDRLRPTSVTTEKLARESVGFNQLADRSVVARTLAFPFELKGSATIPAGSERVRIGPLICPPQSGGFVGASRFSAKAISGGFETDRPGVHVESSKMVGTNAWEVLATNDSGEDATVTVFVYCLLPYE
jgi:hypothetical protein